MSKSYFTSVRFMSKQNAYNIVGDCSDTIMISISASYDNSDGYLLNENVEFKDIFEISINDIDQPIEYKGHILEPMSVYDACKIIEFLFEYSGERSVNKIFVHCHAGISRSAAVAKFAADIFKLNFNHKYSLYNKHIYNLLHKTIRAIF